MFLDGPDYPSDDDLYREKNPDASHGEMEWMKKASEKCVPVVVEDELLLQLKENTMSKGRCWMVLLKAFGSVI